MAPVLIAILFVVALLLFAARSSRQKSIEEGTWLGIAGAKTAYMWNYGNVEQRSKLLASVGVLDGNYRDSLLSKPWIDLPYTIQTSLAQTIGEIDAAR